MTMQVSVKDDYIEEFEAFLKTLPKDAVVIKNHLMKRLKKDLKSIEVER